MVIISWILSQSCQILNIVEIHIRLRHLMRSQSLRRMAHLYMNLFQEQQLMIFKATDTGVTFRVEGKEDAQITLES